jgi:hypothetical protein
LLNAQVHHLLGLCIQVSWFFNIFLGCRGDLSAEFKSSLRSAWFAKLCARNPAVGRYWATHAEEIGSFSDLRRAEHIPRVSKKLRKKIAASGVQRPIEGSGWIDGKSL